MRGIFRVYSFRGSIGRHCFPTSRLHTRSNQQSLYPARRGFAGTSSSLYASASRNPYPTSGALLDILRARTTVDCDLLDASIAKQYGPFEDCTSNQAIAFGELPHGKHERLVAESATLGRDLSKQYPRATPEALAIEICMIRLQLEVSKYLKGCIHIQANPFDAYSTERTVEGAERIVALCRTIDPKFPSSRLCIKIPSTWEGLKACQILQRSGVNTLATTLFTMEQAALAGEVGCRYIAPYVNELAAQTEPNHQDPEPLRELCYDAQMYYERHNQSTQVLPASLTSIGECMAFAGVHHITIAPALLKQLAETSTEDVTSEYPSLFDRGFVREVPERMSFLRDEAAFRTGMTRNQKGRNEAKLIQVRYNLGG